MPAPRAAAGFLAALLLATAATTAAPPSGNAAVPSWPPGEALLIAEVVTGAASASDEFVEIANTSPDPVDLGGCELVYASASGATVTRKASWSAGMLLPGATSLLVANAAGSYANASDAVYSGGLAADGGAVALRCAPGVVDAVGWGTATSAYVEGLPAKAAPAGSSIERRSSGGALLDSNDNATDFAVQAVPTPRRLSDGPAAPSGGPPTDEATPTETASPTASDDPAPTGGPTHTPGQSAEETATPDVTPGATPSDPALTPEPSATLEPSATPEPSATLEPSATPEPTPTPVPEPTPTPVPEPSGTPPSEPTATPTPTLTPIATPEPTAEPTPTPIPTQTPTASPAPTAPGTPTAPPATPPGPSPSAAPTISTVLSARSLPDGARVAVEATLTTGLGALEGGRAGFAQDATAGIGLWLPAVPDSILGAGTVVRLSGTVGERYGQRIVRVDEGAIPVLGDADLPDARTVATGTAGEADEGLRVLAAGVVTQPADELADGTGLWIDDGSGPLRVVLVPAVAATLDVRRGDRLIVSGPLGQHASGSSTGYRILVTEPGAATVVIAPAPTPSPDPSSSPSPTPPASATPTADPTASPKATPATPSPTPSAGPVATAVPLASIAAARIAAPGTRVHVRGTVTAGPGALDAPSLVAIQDSTAGIFVRLPSPLGSATVGAGIEVVGRTASPYGQLEIRSIEWLRVGVAADDVEALDAEIGSIGEASEAALVVTTGTVKSVSVTASGHLAATLAAASDASIRVMAEPAARIGRDDLERGATVTLTGVVGQRATKAGRQDGYRLWLRSPDDISLAGAPAPGATPTAGPSSSHKPDPTSSAAATAYPAASVADAIRHGGRVRFEATVVAGPGLIDTGGSTIVVADGSAALAVRLPSPGVFRIGDRIAVVGVMGHWKTAPRLLATSVTRLGQATPVGPVPLRGELGPDLDWQLVQVRGMVTKATHLGIRWRASLSAGSAEVVVSGVPGAAVPGDRIAKGSTILVTGIVARSTSDSGSFQLVPRSAADVTVVVAALAADSGGSASGSGSRATRGGGAGSPASGSGGPAARLAEVATLAGHAGERVTLSGLIVATGDHAATLDDGTGLIGLVDARSDSQLDLLEVGDAVEVTGFVQADAGGAITLRLDEESVIRLGGTAGGPAAADAGAGAAIAATSTATASRDAARASSALLAPHAVAQDSPAPVLAALLTLAAALGVVVLRRRRRRPAEDPAAAVDTPADATPGPDATPPTAALLAAAAPGTLCEAAPPGEEVVG